MTSKEFENFIQALIERENASKSLREQGFIFERLAKRILQIEPRFKNEFKQVYLWSEFNAKFGVGSDVGIDLMALNSNDEWVSVQCKAYDTNYHLMQGDLKNFLGINTIEGKEASFEIKEFRDYQIEALNATKEHFLAKNEDRAKIIMACGTGKSLLSVRILDEIAQNGEIALN